MSKVAQLWSGLRSSLWFIPGLMVTSAVFAAVVLVEIDTRLARDLSQSLPRLFGAGAAGARGMLSSIAGSMITVAGVTFSITIVALSLASSQFTPRILRNFMGNRTTQVLLGFFVAIFAYCLVVLRTIRGGDEGSFVPSLAVAFGFVLALVGIGVLILFIHHIASSIQASSVISSAAEETLAAVRKLFPSDLGEEAEDLGEDEESLLPSETEWHAIPALKTGYIQNVDTSAMLSFAEEHEVVIRMELHVGEFVVKDAPLVTLAMNRKPDKSFVKQVNGVFAISRLRSVEHDTAFGIMQIVDIALKALSPGINDTTTALTCIDYLSAILAELADRRIETRLRTNGHKLRVIAKGPVFGQLVAASFDQIRLNAAGNVAVLSRLISAIATVAVRTNSRQRKQTLLQHLDLITATARQSVSSPYDLGEALALSDRARALLT